MIKRRGLKMSKLSEKKKIEEIAKNLLKKQKSYKNINTVTDKNRNKITNEFSAINKDKNNINNGEDTLKDNLYFTKSKNVLRKIDYSLQPFVIYHCFPDILCIFTR